jgi:hypothetical protein
MHKHERDEIVAELRSIADFLEDLESSDDGQLIDVGEQLGALKALFDSRIADLRATYLRECREEHELLIQAERAELHASRRGIGLVIPFLRKRGRL